MSYSQKIKEEMLVFGDKLKKCCIFSFLYGFMIGGSIDENDFVIFSTNAKNRKTFEVIASKAFSGKNDFYKIDHNRLSIKKDQIRYFTIAEIIDNIKKCKKCTEYFLRGIFISYGTISNPEVAYRIDFNIGSFDICNQLKDYLVSQGLSPKISKRGDKYFVYLKRSEDVSDFLALCGCNSLSFEILNFRIEKDIRNKANRVTNCDSGNISKSVKASQKYLTVIKILKEKSLIDSLPDNLKEIALLRLENPSLSFSELGKLAQPIISKSGVFHRLEKIIEFYERITENI
ncbi:MAG: DNA-binding protein WhiA [Clostridia bacterium]|nr:DNA-binding protein WhiA [Clostridia bacterium]